MKSSVECSPVFPLSDRNTECSVEVFVHPVSPDVEERIDDLVEPALYAGPESLIVFIFVPDLAPLTLPYVGPARHLGRPSIHSVLLGDLSGNLSRTGRAQNFVQNFFLLEEPEQNLGEKTNREEDWNDEMQDGENFVLLQSVSLLSEGPEQGDL